MLLGGLKRKIKSWDRRQALAFRRAFNGIVLRAGGKQCRLGDVGDMVHEYLQQGWASQTDLFEQSRSCKERCLRSDAKRQRNLAFRLEFLGGLRKMVVHNLFECANDRPGVTTYKAFGSTNLTSDYDLTILGPNAPNVIERMSKAFKSQYKTSLPKAFDSNIYCTGYYSKKGSNPHVPGKLLAVKRGKPTQIFTIEAVGKDTQAVQEQFAWLKICESNKALFEHMAANNTTVPAAAVRRMSNALRSELKRSEGDDKTEKMYTMLIKRAKRYFQQMYGRKKYTAAQTVSLIKDSCAAAWASVEAYYTPASVAVVVLELQAGYTFRNAKGEPVVLQTHTYKCAALENFGDFVHHAKDMRGDLRRILLKLSKYIYRVEHCLEKISGRPMLARGIKDQIVAHRGSGDTGKVQWNLLERQVGKYTSLSDFIRKFARRIMAVIQ